MCIVVDTCTLSPVFNEHCEQHCEFVYVKEWIDKRHGFLVFGGTKFKEELRKAYRYLRLVRQMKDSGHAVPIRDDIVDAEQKRVEALTAGTNCNDQHIIGLLSASKCPLVCSVDTRAYPYFVNRELYPDGTPRVRIYSSSRNRSLLRRPIARTSLKNQA